MTYVLGINAFHGDASACLIVDGKLVAAVEEERFNRTKHWAGFPKEAVRYCLSEGGVPAGARVHVALNSDPKAHLLRKLGYALCTLPSPTLLRERIRNRGARVGVGGWLEEMGLGSSRVQLHFVEHHEAHLASAHYASAFHEAAAVSVDGFGDFTSTAWARATRGSMQLCGRIYFPHSLGVLYQALTQYLGFPNYGDEYKVMGLAPYGGDALVPKLRELLVLRDDGSFRLNLNFFRHHREHVPYQWRDGAPEVGTLYSNALCDLLGSPRGKDDPLEDRHRDIAYATQSIYEAAFFHLLEHAYRGSGLSRLSLAGGCAMNSVANGKITRYTSFKDVYVQPAAGDAGGAVGAALLASQRLGVDLSGFAMPHAYWGPGYDDEELEDFIAQVAPELHQARCEISKWEDHRALCERAVDIIVDGGVLGWFQGRAEWGPRALGNRSILGDPRRADMKAILNSKIKRRESFRPFAPSILRDEVGAWFAVDDDVPFMGKVLPIREEKRDLIPAVTHVDGSGRLQTVDEAHNPKYFDLLRCFATRTGVPILLNTSFNENEPIVCQPGEAMDCFLRTKMDALVLGRHLIARTG